MNCFNLPLVGVFFVVLTCMPASAKIAIRENTEYYSVSGNSGQAIKKFIKRHRITGSRNANQIGITRTKMNVKNIVWEHRNGRCAIKHVDVVLNILYILPKWEKSKLSSSRLIKNWKKFASAIAAHEKTHGKILKESYREMHRKIANYSFRSAKSCNRLQSKIQKIVNDAEKKGDKRNKQFELDEKKNSSVISRAYLNVIATK